MLEEGKRPPTLSALLRKWPVLLRAKFVLTKGPNDIAKGNVVAN